MLKKSRRKKILLSRREQLSFERENRHNFCTLRCVLYMQVNSLGIPMPSNLGNYAWPIWLPSVMTSLAWWMKIWDGVHPISCQASHTVCHKIHTNWWSTDWTNGEWGRLKPAELLGSEGCNQQHNAQLEASH